MSPDQGGKRVLAIADDSCERQPDAESSGCEILLAGERLQLLPEKGVWWPAGETLFVADLHWGKEAAFRAAAIPVPDGLAADLQRLSLLLARTNARRLVVLGDLQHHRSGRTPAGEALIQRWRVSVAGVEIVLVRGNHDRSAGDPPAAWGIRTCAEPATWGPWELWHHPPVHTPDLPAGLAGHFHPGFLLKRGPDRLRLPGYWLRGELLILPAFGGFTGLQPVQRVSGDEAYVIAAERVVRLPGG